MTLLARDGLLSPERARNAMTSLNAPFSGNSVEDVSNKNCGWFSWLNYFLLSKCPFENQKNYVMSTSQILFRYICKERFKTQRMTVQPALSALVFLTKSEGSSH